jgi:hypothetical protein
MQAFNADVQSRVLTLIRTILEQNAIAAQVDSDSRLVDVDPDSRRRANAFSIS